jgi:hypothetical protein
MAILRRLGLCALAVSALAAALAAAGAATVRAAALPTLYVNYSVDCTFTITDDSGKQITSILPGTYQVQLNEPQPLVANAGPGTSGPACNGLAAFQLTGPGVSLATAIDNGDGVNLFTEKFLPSSTYVALDNNQPTIARVVFTTQASGTPPAPTVPYSTTASGKGTTSNTSVVGASTSSKKSSSTPLVLRGTLVATVSPSGKPSLMFKGKSVTSLKAGRYTVSVVDRSRTGGFVLQEIRKPSTTIAGVPFVGKRTTTVTLRAGQWFFYPTFVGSKTYFIVTA